MRLMNLMKEIVTLDITFEDPALEENFYEFEVLRLPLDSSYANSIDIFSDDPNADMGIDAYKQILLSDAGFNGKSYTVQCGLEYESEISDDHIYVVVWRSITKDTYLYSKSVQSQIEADDFGLFAEPVTLHNNVVEGLGIFGLRTETYIACTR